VLELGQTQRVVVDPDQWLLVGIGRPGPVAALEVDRIESVSGQHNCELGTVQETHQLLLQTENVVAMS